MEKNSASEINMTETRHRFSIKVKLKRMLWLGVQALLFRPFIPRFFRKYRVFLLRLFGARIDYTCTVHATVRIWLPENLSMEAYSCLGPHVNCYNQGAISIGKNTVISQYVYLCASTHDFRRLDFPLICKPIHIEDTAWVAADAFIGPGVTINSGAVVGARAAVFKNVARWTVVGGNPAQIIKERIIKNDE